MSGLMADSRTMVDRARVEAQNHWFTYDEKMSVESVAQAVSNLAIQFGDSDDDGNAMSRFHKKKYPNFETIFVYTLTINCLGLLA